jgi:hypothetical protein
VGHVDLFSTQVYLKVAGPANARNLAIPLWLPRPRVESPTPIDEPTPRCRFRADVASFAGWVMRVR